MTIPDILSKTSETPVPRPTYDSIRLNTVYVFWCKMSLPKLLFLCAVFELIDIASSFKVVSSKVESCTPKTPVARELLEEAIGAQPSLAAAFVRGAFHDCITTRPTQKGSGCNGSLRLRTELAFPQNRGLDKLVRAIEPIVRKTCISNADSLQLGLEISMKLTGGPLVQLPTGRIDAKTPDPLDGELPGIDTFEELKTFYDRKGFNVQEMVVSDLGGHSLGKVFGRPFTSTPNKFDNKFAVNVLRISEGQTPLGGFNELSSDLAMAQEEGLDFVKKYAHSLGGLEDLKKDFGNFLERQSGLVV